MAIKTSRNNNVHSNIYSSVKNDVYEIYKHRNPRFWFLTDGKIYSIIIINTKTKNVIMRINGKTYKECFSTIIKKIKNKKRSSNE